MKTRICLVVIIVTGLAVCTINSFMIREAIQQARAQRDRWRQQELAIDSELGSAQTKASEFTMELAGTTHALIDASNELAQTRIKAADTAHKIVDMTEQLAKVTVERDDARATAEACRQNLAQVAELAERIKHLESIAHGLKAENAALRRAVLRADAEIADDELAVAEPVRMASTLAGQVLLCNRQWGFAVLNVGEQQGAITNGELLVTRNGSLIGILRITRVENDRCIANFEPRWKRGELMEGDQVIPRYPG